MSLESLLAKLKADVSPVSDVQASTGAALRCNVTETADALDVSGLINEGGNETSDTSRQNQPYQAKPAWIGACTPDTSETPQNTNADGEAIAPTPATWRELHAEYLSHHWNCRTCIAGGQGRGLRCGVGAALWTGYTGAVS